MAGSISLVIRRATSDDEGAVWAMLEPVIRAGDTYALPRDMTREAAIGYWLGPDKTSFVAEDDGVAVGTYYLRANQSGGGDHVCNCGYVTSERARRRGVGRLMCEHSLKEAPKYGFRAMQFNCVVSTNGHAVKLWKELGFEIVGTLPGAFCHPSKGDVDAYVMFRIL
jgi:ribosomal protein S18 acetylase RimI-like enzyme